MRVRRAYTTLRYPFTNPDEDMAGVIASQTRPLRSTPGSSRFACATKIVGEAPWSHRSTLVFALVAMLTEIYYAGAVPPSARRPPSLATFLAAPTILFCARSCDMEAASPTHRASLAVGIISHILAKPWTPFRLDAWTTRPYCEVDRARRGRWMLSALTHGPNSAIQRALATCCDRTPNH